MKILELNGNGYSVVAHSSVGKGSKSRWFSTHSVDITVHPVNEKTDNAKTTTSGGPAYSYMFKIEHFRRAYLKLKPGVIPPGKNFKLLDGTTEKIFEDTINSLKDRSFQFKPSKLIYIKKSNGQLRPLGVPSLWDKIVLSIYTDLLEKRYEKIFHISSHGFRPKKSCHTALTTINK